MTDKNFSKDIVEFLSLLYKHRVKYLIVGGEAVIYYVHPRLTGDIDIFYGLSAENVEYLWNCLQEFWEGNIPGLENASELTRKGVIVQFGLAPNRIDLINDISGVEFDDAWESAVCEEMEREEGKIRVNYIHLKHLVQNKKAAGRNKDLDDLNYLKKLL